MQKSILLFLSLLLIFNMGCGDDDLPMQNPPIKNGFFVVNEGGFNHGNASLGYYNQADNIYSDKLFKNANQRTLGDIFQGLYFHQDKGYCVLNNSGYIEIIDTSTYQQIDRISGLNAPRNMLFVDDNRAYISDLYANSIQVWDLTSNTLTKTIPIPSWTEEMVQVEDQVFVVAPWDTRERIKNQIYVINTPTDALIDSITVGFDPIAIQQDIDHKLWVFCRGDATQNVRGGLYQINPQTLSVKKSFLFDDFETGINDRLAINGTKDTLYYLKKDIFRMSIDDNTLPETPFITATSQNLYSLGIAPGNGQIITSDAKDFVQKGTVLIYESDGSLKDSFSAGVIPSGFVFE